MVSSRNLVTTEFRGVRYAADFDDSTTIQDIGKATISKIIVYHDTYINSLAVYYTGSESAVTHGSNDGSRSDVILQPSEFITTIEGVVDCNIMGQLSFVTSTGKRFGPYGRTRGLQTNESYVWNAASRVSPDLAPNMGLLYFSGNCGTKIHQLCATFARYTYGTTTPKDLKYERIPRTEPISHASVLLSRFAKNIMSPIVTLLVGPESVQFHAYEVPLCRLPFFRAALLGEFREALEKKITMPDEEPHIASALLEFLYTDSYTYAYYSDAITVHDSADDNHVSDLIEGSFHVGVYAVASKYDCQPLGEVAVKNFLHVLQNLTGMDVVRLWKAAYEKGLSIELCAEGGRMQDFQQGLPKLLKEVYKSDSEEMGDIISEFLALANDFMKLLVSDG